jgi:hypothetical protein
MLLNLAIASSVGLVPVVGDVLLAVFRANSRNAALLEEFLRLRGEGVASTTAETTGAPPAGEELRTVHEAGQDIDDAPLERKRPWFSRQDVGDKGATTSALPDESQVLQHRDSRFVEDVT